MKKGFLYLGIAGWVMSGIVSADENTSNLYVGAGYGVIPEVEPEQEDYIKLSDANNGFIQLGYKISENFAIEGQYSKSTKDASTNVLFGETRVNRISWNDIIQINPDWSMAMAQSAYPYAFMDLALTFDVNIETTAIYGVYRSSGDLYFKLKGGYLREKSTLKINPKSFDLYAYDERHNKIPMASVEKGEKYFDAFAGRFDQKFSESESAFSAGLGAGYQFSARLFSELEYTMLNDDLNFYSLNINYAL